MEAILTTKNLTKTYKGYHAVNNVSLTVNRGDIYGFVGLNGSGKTTFIRLVTSLITANGGSFELFGQSGKKRENLKRISSMVETPSIYPNLSADDNLFTQCRVAGIASDKIKETAQSLLELVGLTGTGDKKASKFSLGMRQRLGIAMALVGDPEFMLLDEPTNGLDPAGIREMRELLQKLNRERGITILVSSHILGELGKLATRYGFIHRGLLIQEITAGELFASCGKKVVVEASDTEKALAALEAKKIPGTLNDAGKIEICGDVTVSQVFRVLEAAKVEILSAQTEVENLETYFINLIRAQDAINAAQSGGYEYTQQGGQSS